jgi:putative flippase GtrA
VSSPRNPGGSGSRAELVGLADLLFRRETDSTLIQLFRYLWVAGVAFVVDFSTLFLLTHFAGLHYLASAAIAFLLGLVTNYTLSIRWVFNRRARSDKRAEFVVFALVGAAGLGLNELFLWIFTDLASLHYLISKLISTGLVFFFNFFVRKALLFTKRAS